MKVCIINPPYITKSYSSAVMGTPLPCLVYLKGSLRNKNHHVDLIDAKLEGLSFEDVMGRVKSSMPDIVAISVVTTDMPIARDIAKAVKEINPEVLVIVGGAHPTSTPQKAVSGEPNFDIAVIGEGEVTFAELIDALDQKKDYSKIDGIVYRKNNEVVLTQPRKYVEDLDELPFPEWKNLPPGNMYYVQISRGCPFQCSFCYRLFGQKVRVHSPARIIREIQSILEYVQPEEFFFSAATFGLPKDHSIELFDALIDSGLNKKIKWRAATRPGLHDLDFFKKMKEAGCFSVGFGIESGDEEILKKTSKDSDLKGIEKSINMAKAAGLETVGFFIFGHPYETKKTALKTSNLAIKLNLSLVTMGIMTPWPGTNVFEMAHNEQGDYILDKEQPIEGQHKHFGKRVLLFNNIKLSYIQWLRIRTYFLLYFKNKRFREGISFFAKYLEDGILFLREAAADIIFRR